MGVEEIIENLNKLKSEDKTLFVTSSFQTHSIPLVHIIARSGLDIPVYCLNTGFLFPETLTFKDQLATEFGIEIRSIFSDIPKIQQRDSQGNMLFTSDPDYCCHINKVKPTENLLKTHDVWVNGVRRDQNANRKTMKTFQPAGHEAIRFHPMLEWTGKDIFDYIKKHNLPRHPLDDAGYSSIGCEPCTRKAISDDPREARWFGMNKTECGLHTDLVENK